MNNDNSVLFDIDSIIDKEATALGALRDLYNNQEDNRNSLDNIYHMDYLSKLDDDKIKWGRIHRSRLFRDFIIDDTDKMYDLSIIDNIYDASIDGNIFITSMAILISAYKKAGNGTITTAIRIDPGDNISRDILNRYKIYPDNILELDRPNVDTDKYGRIISGNSKSILKYRIDKPKNILMLSYADNFLSDDRRVLDPELIVNLGDICDIKVVSPYRDIN